jgi:hypothetical protein
MAEPPEGPAFQLVVVVMWWEETAMAEPSTMDRWTARLNRHTHRKRTLALMMRLMPADALCAARTRTLWRSC